VLKIVNPEAKPVSASIMLEKYSPKEPFATVEDLNGPLDVVNSAKSPSWIRPVRKQWVTHFENGKSRYDFPPHSLTLIKFN
jgi:hypothetical protein